MEVRYFCYSLDSFLPKLSIIYLKLCLDNDLPSISIIPS